MKTLPVWVCVILLLSVLVSPTLADYLVVSRDATIKALPDRHALILERVGAGERLELLDEGDQEKGYYHVRASQGLQGWIYRTLVRRYEGPMPLTDSERRLADPLADPTLITTQGMVEWAARHLSVGKPQAVYERVREGYALGQDARLKIAVWVQYELTPEDLSGDADRLGHFLVDSTIPKGSRSSDGDYNDSGYDRGHMAPADDMDRSDQVMRESFYLSNITPQVGEHFNREIWLALEEAVRGWVLQRGALTVITGPVFEVDDGAVTYDVIGRNNVAVPTHFFKIVVDTKPDGGPEALAFLLPNEDLDGRSFEEEEFRASIDDIEKATGLNFLSGLTTMEQKSVESEAADEVW
ncbi:DNA/RNA non-specific endonuclease [bacterium]|nr:DNA/RNA non-specific endonuclease [bacterium]